MLKRIVDTLKKGPTPFDILCVNTAVFTDDAPDDSMHMYSVLSYCAEMYKHGLVTHDESSPVVYAITQKGLDQFTDCDSCGRPWHEEGAKLRHFVAHWGPTILCVECAI